LVAIGLVFAIEGILFAAFPGPVKRAMAHVTETADRRLAAGWDRFRGDRGAAGVAGSGVNLRGRSRFSALIAGSVVVDEVLSA
jgi:hypothetical protein